MNDIFVSNMSIVMSEHLAKVFKSQGVNTYHKSFNTLKSVLIQPKDRTPWSEKRERCTASHLTDVVG